jgi:1-acyl-sn-glycerol-3-phosphate acyltransferase
VVGTIPARGGILLAANHASYFDIPLLGCGIPRRAWYLGRSDLFPFPVVNWILQALGWIPLRMGRLDRDAFSKAAELLRQGKALVIFPEGGRTQTGRLRPGKPGIGLLVAQTKVPVVPVYIHGTYEVLPQGARWPKCRPVTVTFGAPLDFSEALARLEGKEFYRHVSQTVMAKIAELGGVSDPGVVIEADNGGQDVPLDPSSRVLQS